MDTPRWWECQVDAVALKDSLGLRLRRVVSSAPHKQQQHSCFPFPANLSFQVSTIVFDCLAVIHRVIKTDHTNRLVHIIVSLLPPTSNLDVVFLNQPPPFHHQAVIIQHHLPR